MRRLFIPLKIGVVAALVIVSSYCTHRDKKTENLAVSQALSSDETYLVDTYVRIAKARDLHAVSALESESLFVALGAAVDTARIARTIRELDAAPDRWILVFRAIEKTRRGDETEGRSE